MDVDGPCALCQVFGSIRYDCHSGSCNDLGLNAFETLNYSLVNSRLPFSSHLLPIIILLGLRGLG